MVLNLADGAIGYLENDMENLKIFDVISNALKPGGKHFMDICNAEHAEQCFPKSAWETGETSIALSKFEWDPEKRIMLFAGFNNTYGEPARKPEIIYGDPISLYSLEEIKTILAERNMVVQDSFSDYYGRASSYKNIQLMVSSVKRAWQTLLRGLI